MITNTFEGLQYDVQINQAEFSIGQLVQHRLFEYRGVIVDIDPVFMGSEQWYQEVAKSRPPKDKPWYRLLVHDASHETYVAERNLEADDSNAPVNHPLVGLFFRSFDQGRYHMNMRTN